MFHPHQLKRTPVKSQRKRQTERKATKSLPVPATPELAIAEPVEIAEATTTLLALPEEILVLICSFLPLQNLLANIALINRRFQSIAQTALKDKLLIANIGLITQAIAAEKAGFQRNQATNQQDKPAAHIPKSGLFAYANNFFSTPKKILGPTKQAAHSVTLPFAKMALVKIWLDFCAPKTSLLQANLTIIDIETITAAIKAVAVNVYHYAIHAAKNNRSNRRSNFKLAYEAYDFISAFARARFYLKEVLSTEFFDNLFQELSTITTEQKDAPTEYEHSFILPSLFINTNAKKTLSNFDNFQEEIFIRLVFFAIKAANDDALEAFLAIKNAKKQKLLIQLCVLIGTPETLIKFLEKFKPADQSSVDYFYAISAQDKTPLLVQLINNDITAYKGLFLSSDHCLPPTALAITTNMNRYTQLNMVAYLTSKEFTDHPTWPQQFEQFLAAATEKQDEAIIERLKKTPTSQPNTSTSTTTLSL